MTIDQIKALGKDDLLNMLGLETKRSNADYVMPALAVFGVGALVGVGLGLLLAPRPGRELREDISRRVAHAPEALAALPHKASDALHRASEQVSEMMHENHS
jgi:gas vesicle protein